MVGNLVKSASVLVRLNLNRNVYTYHSNYAYWNKDWLPGPYPKTEEECINAAKKYNLHPEEYKPYPDDGFGYGDYPNLPYKGVALRDPYYPYDQPEYKRNFNESVHIDIDLLSEDRCDVGASQRYSRKFVILSFCIIFGGLFGSCYLSNSVPIFQPVMEKQYPWNGKKYYTFIKNQ
ncbi:NADH dehydrogenase [ubiquinone] 1 beta subcomplex subunit 8, mitochondrial [Phymastichus coffea]|uniref:NADH dehydrogenase [ubiquinone] 1 beta subcomplex subunit 8, mitochondrial n=1 Tax=Phymastichus coffea TaxID=108790 RepID=UPI00273BC2D7|nr:NADH dehydrogenase [ubiquinone] 1 beta subcomplex subunit 8, mitochondrial [Phymastichus coffea]